MTEHIFEFALFYRTRLVTARFVSMAKVQRRLYIVPRIYCDKQKHRSTSLTMAETEYGLKGNTFHVYITLHCKHLEVSLPYMHYRKFDLISRQRLSAHGLSLTLRYCPQDGLNDWLIELYFTRGLRRLRGTKSSRATRNLYVISRG